jgi:hypothetical protein
MSTPLPLAAPTTVAAGRDLRLDLLRGLCVAVMVVGHLGWLKREPHLPLGWATAAEGFFLLSGATLGTVARRWRGGERFAALLRRLPRRALWLYGVNLLLVVAAYQWAVARPFTGRIAARRFGDDPFWLGVLRFDHPLSLDILPRYAVFLLVAPAVLLAVRSRRGALGVAALSAALWLAYNLVPGGPTLPFFERSRPAFAAATWQLLFFGGILLADPAQRAAAPLGPRGRRARLWIAAGGTAAFVLAKALLGGSAAQPDGALGPWLARDLLGPLRLLNLFFVALLAWELATRFREPLVRALGPLLLPLGQNALPAFLLHLPLLWWTQSLRLPPDREWIRLVAALAALVAISLAVRWPRLRRLLAPV